LPNALLGRLSSKSFFDPVPNFPSISHTDDESGALKVGTGFAFFPERELEVTGPET
jgi:hypothetical protein